MDNNFSDNFPQLTINPSLEENIINPDLNAPNPVSNPQIINQNKPSPYIPPDESNYEPNYESHLCNTNIPSNVYPDDQNNSPTQGFPYYSPSPEPFPSNEERVENYISQNHNQRKCLIMILIMPILMLIYLFCENRILSPLGKDFYNKLTIADEIGILICAIVFLITFIFNNIIKNNILKLRTVITSLVFIIGFIIRMIGFGGFHISGSLDDFDEEMDKQSKQFTLIIIRTFLLFISIIISVINSKNN